MQEPIKPFQKKIKTILNVLRRLSRATKVLPARGYQPQLLSKRHRLRHSKRYNHRGKREANRNSPKMR